MPALAKGVPVDASCDDDVPAAVPPAVARKLPPWSASTATGRLTAVPGSPEGASAEASMAATGRSGNETASGVVPFNRSATGCSTGSSKGNASTSGAVTVSTKPAAASSAAAATGIEKVETVPAGTTWFTTGSAATKWSDAPARLPTRGCTSPGEGDTGGEGATGAGAAPLERDETEDVTAPSREPGSVDESAVAAEVDNVIQVRVAAPVRRTGRRIRHGHRALATRTTPNAVETADFYSVGPSSAASLGRMNVYPSN